VSQHALYLANRDLIERALGLVCRRQRLSPEDAEDFRSTFTTNLLADDCASLRKFQGRSSLQTFLLTTITHAFQDWRNARWGKWRPSAEAERLGPQAVLIEQLVVRDRRPVDETFEILTTNHGLAVTRQFVEDVISRLKPRASRTTVAEDALELRPSAEPGPERSMRQQEAAETARKARGLLAAAVGDLSVEDRLLLRLSYQDGLSIADIARALRTEQKPLYRRREQICARLRAALEAAGLSAESIREALDERGFEDASAEESAGGVRPLQGTAHGLKRR